MSRYGDCIKTASMEYGDIVPLKLFPVNVIWTFFFSEFLYTNISNTLNILKLVQYLQVYLVNIFTFLNFLNQLYC